MIVTFTALAAVPFVITSVDLDVVSSFNFNAVASVTFDSSLGLIVVAFFAIIDVTFL